MKEAAYYSQLDSGNVKCELCPHSCILKEEAVGRCHVRQNKGGKLYTLNYGKVTGIAIDPIEKKPLHFWRPGSQILSFGTFGCNMSCKFCQNFNISQKASEYAVWTPDDIVNEAKNLKIEAIAYTYNEPTVYYEMVYDTATLAKQNGIANVLVTNGFINEEPLLELLPLIDAMNIDVKTYSSSIYKMICGGDLEPVMRTAEIAVKHKVHVELTCLLVPGLFDDLSEVELLFKHIRDRVGDVPLHLSRYFPKYMYTEPSTEISRMLEVQYIAHKYFSYAKLGNVV